MISLSKLTSPGFVPADSPNIMHSATFPPKHDAEHLAISNCLKVVCLNINLFSADSALPDGLSWKKSTVLLGPPESNLETGNPNTYPTKNLPAINK